MDVTMSRGPDGAWGCTACGLPSVPEATPDEHCDAAHPGFGAPVVIDSGMVSHGDPNRPLSPAARKFHGMVQADWDELNRPKG